MKTKFDANQAFKTLIDQIENAISFASARSAPYTPLQIAATTYNLMFQTGLVHEACQEWRHKLEANKTWANFKVSFANAHQEFRESQITANSGGYNSTNAIM